MDNNRSYIFYIVVVILSLIDISTAQEQDNKRIPKGLLLEAPSIQSPSLIRQMSSTVIFEETFESGGTSWSRTGSWAIGSPTSGPNSGYNSTNCVATNLFGDYSNNARDSLRSPSISLPALGAATQITLQFWEWYQTESRYDYGYVRISTNGGISWTLLNSRSGSSSWRLTQIDLTSYANRNIILMFDFTSDGNVTYPGWYVDNIQITKNDPKPITATLSSLNSQSFPFIYMNVGIDTFGRGIATLTQSNFEVYENNILQTDYFQVVPPETGAGVRLTDIVFLMDNSGSMSEEIAAVRNNVIAFVNNLVSSGVNFALGLCRFGASQNSGYPIIEDNGNLTTDANYFKNTVWSRNVINGGFEPGWDALYTSANSFNFRPGSQKVFILITDENVTEYGNQGQRSQQDAIQILQSRSILTFALIDSSNSYSRQDYCPVAQATTGACYDIYSPFDVILDRIGGLVSNTYEMRRVRRTDTQFFLNRFVGNY